MIFLIVIILLVILLIFATSKNKEEVRSSLRNVAYIVLGILAFFLLVRFFHPIAAVVTGIFISVIPLLRNVLNAISIFAILKGALMKLGIKAPKYKGNPFSRNNSISEEEARDILGVDKNASKVEINNAYRNQMKTHHPDKGGSKYFAEKLSLARDKLIGDK